MPSGQPSIGPTSVPSGCMMSLSLLHDKSSEDEEGQSYMALGVSRSHHIMANHEQQQFPSININVRITCGGVSGQPIIGPISDQAVY